MFQKILVPFDGSDSALRALAAAREIAEKFQSELRIITVVANSYAKNWTVAKTATDNSQAEPQCMQPGEEIQQPAKELMSGFTGNVTYVIRQGAPVETVLDEVKQSKSDAIVMGHRGLSALKTLLLGSVSQELTQLCDVPVLITK